MEHVPNKTVAPTYLSTLEILEKNDKSMNQRHKIKLSSLKEYMLKDGITESEAYTDIDGIEYVYADCLRMFFKKD